MPSRPAADRDDAGARDLDRPSGIISATKLSILSLAPVISTTKLSVEHRITRARKASAEPQRLPCGGSPLPRTFDHGELALDVAGPAPSSSTPGAGTSRSSFWLLICSNHQWACRGSEW